MTEILLLIAIAIIGYLLGSISFAYLLSKLALNRDIRKYGSGNAGTANMLRNFGWKLGIPTFLGDTLKGVLACYLGQLIAGTFGYALLGACIGAVFAVVGHTYPVFLKFKGGKGIATTLGIILFLYFDVNIWVVVIALIFIAIFARVSVGSVVGIILAVIAAFVFIPYDNYFYQIALSIMAFLCLYSHRENIKRIFNGTEPKMDFSKAHPKRIRKKNREKV